MSESRTLDGLRYTAEAMERLILDLALARRVEMVEAASAVDRAELLQRIKPGSGAAAKRIAGRYAAHCAAESPLTQAVAIGLDGATTQGDFDRMESFYRERDQPVGAEVCPLADAAFVEQFGKRGYRVTEFTNVMARTFSPNSVSEQVLPPGVTVERIGSEYADLWGATLADGFADQPPARSESVEEMTLFVSSPGVECYLARVDGKAAGGGALSFWNGTARLFCASTLRQFRGRGVQTGLLQTRLVRAAESGSDMAMCFAGPGSTSQRNIVRHGFQTLDTRAKFERHCR
jgi:hypothetical protein